MIQECLLNYPGFIYRIGARYYYLGKWICKECTDTQATDCVVMYEMCRAGAEEAETAMYFHKIRAYSDFALDVPYNPVKIAEDMQALIKGLPEGDAQKLEIQAARFEEDHRKYCGPL